MADFDYLTDLPGEDRERRWIQERLETLSVRESFALAAAVQRNPPQHTVCAINHLESLREYEVRPDTGSYEALGELYLRNDACVPKDVLPFVDFYEMGKRHEDAHPGLFVGSCYVEYPKKTPALAYLQGDLLPDDSGWSVRMKLASPAVPEGVWLRLPGEYRDENETSIDETLALQELQVHRWDECKLLDARCVLPQIENLAAQYSEICDLLYDGTELGFALSQRGQGMPHFAGRYAAALELENCHDLRLALDIVCNLHCYDWVSCDGPEGFAAEHLRNAGVSDGVIRSGSIDLNSYGTKLLEDMNYTPADGGGYIRRNQQEFHYQFSTPAPEQSGMAMQ